MDVRPFEDPGPHPPCAPPEGYFTPPAGLLEPRATAEGRLIPALREAARSRDPMEILFRAALARVQGQATLVNALADLSVTGREAYTRFRAAPPTQEAVRNTVAARGSFNSASVTSAVQEVFARAMRVAWAIRGPTGVRRQLRPGLGWIAVSGEDDPPHRPVNVFSAPHPQHDLLVSCRGMAITTRFMVAAPHPGAAEPPFDPFRLPPDELPFIPPQCDLLLFLHGHMSRLEEAMTLVPSLHQRAAAAGRGYAVVAMDLPSNGYTTFIDHQAIAAALRSFDSEVLRFLDEFVEQFVDELVRTTGTPARVAGVMGGSLGGNLVLRMAERQPPPPWARRYVAWSPASVWHSYIRTPPAFDAGLDAVLTKAIERSTAPELVSDPQQPLDSREEYFRLAFHEAIPGIVTPQAQQWYSPSWPCRDAVLGAARLDRWETYHPLFRMWHWRLGADQLMFSHAENGPDGRPRWERIRGPLLLCAGRDDDFAYTGIWSATGDLARAMTATVGHTLFLLGTGHSMHAERPDRMAREIVGFLAQEPWPTAVRIETRDRRRLGVQAGAAVLGAAGESFAVAYQRVLASTPLTLRAPSGFLTVAGDTVLRAAAQPDPGMERFSALRLGPGEWAVRGARFNFLLAEGSQVRGTASDAASATPFRFTRADDIPADLPGQPVLDAPGLCRRPGPPEKIDHFARDPAGNVLHRTFRDDAWSPWASLNWVVTSEPAAVSWGGDRLDVFARGVSGGLEHIWRDHDGVGWGWQTLGGVLASSPAAASVGYDHLDVFVRGTDGAVYTWFHHAGRHGWQGLGGRIDGTPAAAVRGPGSVDVLARAGQALVWRRRHDWTWEAAWRPPDTRLSLAGSPAAGPAGTAVVVVARTADGRVWRMNLEDGQPPQLLGGIAVSAAALLLPPGPPRAVVLGTDRGLWIADALGFSDRWTPFAR